MAQFAYNVDGGNTVTKDYPLDSTYNATTAKKGDWVVLNGSGKIVKVVAGTGTTVTGLLEGVEFTGLVAGTPWATKTASVTGMADGMAKVRLGKENVYRMPIGNATAAFIGQPVGNDANNAVATGATAKPFRLVDVQGTDAFVQII